MIYTLQNQPAGVQRQQSKTMSKHKIFFLLALFIFAAPACNATLPAASPAPTQQSQPTENAIPRISVADAKSALDGGKAVIVDVRGAEFFAESHIAGAINIPLTDIESNPAGIKLDKDQWIVTYCT